MKRTIAIIGGGPSALMLAAQLDEKKFEVSIYEKNAAPGRKFLVAGQGGFNLTHSEPLEDFVQKYVPATFFEPLLHSFSNVDMQNWLKEIGIPTFVGSSKRVFPVKGIKPIEVLDVILEILKTKNVKIAARHEWKGWQGGEGLLFDFNGNSVSIKPDLVVFALGGGSWKVTGSDGKWINYFTDKKIDIIPFQPANCAIKIDWPVSIVAQFEGKPLKNVSMKCDGKEKQGEVVLSAFGMEGSLVYALNPQVRNQLKENGKAVIFLDLKPTLDVLTITKRIELKPGKVSMSKFLEDDLKLSKVQLLLLKQFTSKEDFTFPEKIARAIKGLALEVTGLAPIDEAISTVGGIALNEITSKFELKKMKKHFAIGEMLDWDAPTGGYLLQACFSMGFQLAAFLNK